ncbi:MAG TPA: hypothetical protein VGB43_03005 [Flavobacterium sp.]|jgi:hypothetical protein
MSTIKNFIAGLGGAIALNIIHESLKKKGSDMPRIDLLGEEAVQKSVHYLGGEISDEDNLYLAALGADIISNALYYSAVGVGGRKQIWQRATALGLAAGVSAVALPKPLGLNSDPVARSTKAATLTVTYYLAGALMTASILSLISSKGK